MCPSDHAVADSALGRPPPASDFTNTFDYNLAMQKSEIKPGEEYALRETSVPGTDHRVRPERVEGLRPARRLRVNDG